MHEEANIVKHNDIPDTWQDRCSGDGWTTKFDSKGNRYYDDGTSKSVGIKPCKNCGSFPTHEGYDACLGNLGNVINACCGHGKDEGYIQFEDKIIEGLFSVRPKGTFKSDKNRIENEIQRFKDNISFYQALIRRREDVLVNGLDHNGNLRLGWNGSADVIR